ncbi:hypothetical protein J6590_080043 [Homalodisca vitripennis]|nr:hypothetical protein J6590_080043 [Homalodisca vitripennis]
MESRRDALNVPDGAQEQVAVRVGEVCVRLWITVQGRSTLLMLMFSLSQCSRWSSGASRSESRPQFKTRFEVSWIHLTGTTDGEKDVLKIPPASQGAVTHEQPGSRVCTKPLLKTSQEAESVHSLYSRPAREPGLYIVVTQDQPGSRVSTLPLFTTSHGAESVHRRYSRPARKPGLNIAVTHDQPASRGTESVHSRYSRPARKPGLYIAVTHDQPGSRVCTKPLLKTSQEAESLHSRYSRPARKPSLYIAVTHDQPGSRVCTNLLLKTSQEAEFLHCRYSRPARELSLYIVVTHDQPGGRVCTKPLLKNSPESESVHSRYSRPARKPSLHKAVIHDQPGSRICTLPLLTTSQGAESVHSRYSRPTRKPSLYKAVTHDQPGSRRDSRVCTKPLLKTNQEAESVHSRYSRPAREPGLYIVVTQDQPGSRVSTLPLLTTSQRAGSVHSRYSQPAREPSLYIVVTHNQPGGRVYKERVGMSGGSSKVTTCGALKSNSDTADDTTPATLQSVDDKLNTIMQILNINTDDIKEIKKEQKELGLSNLVIYRVPEEKNEHILNVVRRVAAAIQFQKWSTNLIDAVYRTGKGSNAEPRPIIIKFISRLDRDEFLRSRKQRILDLNQRVTDVFYEGAAQADQGEGEGEKLQPGVDLQLFRLRSKGQGKHNTCDQDPLCD